MGFPNIWNLIPRPNLTHLVTYICVCGCVGVRVCAHTCAWVYIYIYIYTHVCIHVGAYIQFIVSHSKWFFDSRYQLCMDWWIRTIHQVNWTVRSFQTCESITNGHTWWWGIFCSKRYDKIAIKFRKIVWVYQWISFSFWKSGFIWIERLSSNWQPSQISHNSVDFFIHFNKCKTMNMINFFVAQSIKTLNYFCAITSQTV